MTSLIISKDKYTLKEAREIAKQFMVPTKCKVVMIACDLFYCFGIVPTDSVIYDINHTEDNTVIFLDVPINN